MYKTYILYMQNKKIKRIFNERTVHDDKISALTTDAC